MPAGTHKKQKACLSPRPTRPRIWYNCDNPSFCALLIIIVFAFGISRPLSIFIDLFDNDEEKNKHVVELINNNFDLSPRGIREMLGLNKPIYSKTAAYGHFGRNPESDGSFSWEKTDKRDIFSK